MRVEVKRSAVKDLLKISEPYKSKIKNRIKELENFPNVSNIKKLVRHDPNFRLRIGDYRVLFDVRGNTVYVARIQHRRESYK